MRLVKSSDDGELKRAYQELKVCLESVHADRAREEWWEAKVAEAVCMRLQ